MELKADYLLQGPLRHRRRRPLLLWGAGRDGGRFGRLLQQRGVAIQAFVDISPRRVGQTRHGRPVIAPSQLGQFARPLVLVVVPVPQARPLIRRQLTRRGLREGDDYWVCA